MVSGMNWTSFQTENIIDRKDFDPEHEKFWNQRGLDEVKEILSNLKFVQPEN